MPNIQPYIEGKFALAGFSLQNGTTVTFINEGKMVENPFQNRGNEEATRFVIGIEVNGQHKLVSPNAKSLRELSVVFSTDTSKWVGRSARISIERKKVYGQMKNVAFFHPIVA